jgi:Tol biopolymer transport system component
VHFGMNRARRLTVLTGLAGLVLAGTVGAQGASAAGDTPAKTTLLLKGAGVATISATGRYVAYTRNFEDARLGSITEIFVLDRASGRSQLASVSNSGVKAEYGAKAPSISANGRFVAFASEATNLTAGTPTAKDNIYVRDMQAQKTVLVSVGMHGGSGDSDSESPSISADGRRIAFYSTAKNLVPGLARGFAEVYVRDLDTHTTTAASRSSQKGAGHEDSLDPVISSNGRYVTFESRSSNLAAGDTERNFDMFVHDLQAGKTRWVSNFPPPQGGADAFTGSVSNDGRVVAYSTLSFNGDIEHSHSDVYVWEASTAASRLLSTRKAGIASHSFNHGPSVSADGRFVAFSSWPLDHGTGPDASPSDVYLTDLKTGITRRPVVGIHGARANGSTGGAQLSADGKSLLFSSDATNLVPGDNDGVSDYFVQGPLR